MYMYTIENYAVLLSGTSKIQEMYVNVENGKKIKEWNTLYLQPSIFGRKSLTQKLANL